MLLGFALGNLWRLLKSKNRADLLGYLIKLDLPAVEISLSKVKEVYSFKPNKKQINWLNSREYVSLHLPYLNKLNKREITKLLYHITQLSKKIKIQNIIIHPDALPPKEILEKYSLPISTENLVKSMDYDIATLRRVVRDYEINICLDVAHAFTWSKNEIAKLIKEFKGKISQVHFSGTKGQRDHLSLKKISNSFLDSIKPLKELDVPIIIEEDMKFETIKEVKEEVNYIKEVLRKL